MIIAYADLQDYTLQAAEHTLKVNTSLKKEYSSFNEAWKDVHKFGKCAGVRLIVNLDGIELED